MPSAQRKIYPPMPFIPTTSFSGLGTQYILRGENMWIRFPREGTPYAEGYKGHENLNETIATKTLSGTIAWEDDSNIVTGTGTAFLSEIRIGQFIFGNSGQSNNQLLVVEEVVSNTIFKVTEIPSTNATGSTAIILPVIFPVGVNRGTAIRGNVVQFPKGHFLGVGDGNFRVNGSNLSAPLTLEKKPKFALYDPVTGNYTEDDVGIDLPAPVGPAIKQVEISALTPATPTKMRAGSYNIRVCAKNTETLGFSNPSEAMNASEIVTLTNGQSIQVTFKANMADDQNAWDIYVTQFSDNAEANIEGRYMGPWYLVKTVTATELGSRNAGTTHELSFADAEIAASIKILTFDNFHPVDAEFVDLINGIPIYFSCLGKGNADKTTGTSPGPAAIPSKPSNPEAVFLNKAFTTAGGDYILGEFNAKSRIYVLCQNSLQTVILTTLEAEPIAFRSLWNSGFRNPYNVDFIKEYIYGFSTQGIVRSVAGGDDSAIEFEFASDIEDYVRNWHTGKVITKYDPKNKAMCFFLSGAEKRNGFWVTICLPFLVNKGVWNPPIVLGLEDRDFIVSGAATIGEELILVAGGSNAANVVSMGTYVFDGGDSQERDWYLAWQYTNDSVEEYLKRVKGVSLIGRFSDDVSLKLYGAGPDDDFDIDSLEAGTNFQAELIVDTTAGAIRSKNYNFMDWDPFLNYTLRLSGTHIGEDVDRLDKMSIKYEVNSSEV